MIEFEEIVDGMSGDGNANDGGLYSVDMHSLVQTLVEIENALLELK